MSDHDVLFGFRLRLFSLAGEIGVRPACRAMGVHHSTYYRWKRRVDRWGLEALRVRERRRPRMPNELGPHIEQRIVAFALAHPGLGPKRIAAELARERWGGLRISANGIWRVLRRHGLNTRAKRLALVAGYQARYERAPLPEKPRHIETSRPGELVGLDCFYIGRLTGTKGAVWQYTAIDLHSSFAWAELHSSPRNPQARHCAALVEQVAAQLAKAGWRLESVLTDNGSEFRSHEFTDPLAGLGIRQRRIHAGRPQTNGHVERLQQTILEECWRPSFARSLVPKLTALERDLKRYLAEYNFDRAHTGRLTQGRVPGEIVYGARKVRPPG
ncbi:MAG: DDE-type integrase/transposase/recombinase [Thermoanaerobaculia bacterium]